ncbi:MAG: Glu-tRNA(Gln) amidotransferase subunit GatE [DPANN group archaeon]|nr:Glu-tRNA(Gln) amidotransferase subunit GatE [DPANN group archaeon]
MVSHDYKKLNFKCGLEFHQALDTGKLFCSCSSKLSEELFVTSVERRLRPVAGETGNVDPAVLFESFRDRSFVYNIYAGESCLVELDCEPPHPVNALAFDVSLKIALMLNLDIPHEIFFMRKTVNDGSATSGFQRTALIGTGNMNSIIKSSFGDVHIENMSLEEDASKIEKREGAKVYYSLSRLGIPLVEIGTAPEIKTPEHALDIAKIIGTFLRSFNEIKRGIGTIRQDVNISIAGGERIEVKGWQDLNKLPRLIENEVSRQIFLIEFKNYLVEKNFTELKTNSVCDVTDIFKTSKSKLVSRMLSGDSVVLSLKLENFSEQLKRDVCVGKTFGKELAEYAMAYGVKGMIHSDEDLSKYGLETEFKTLSKYLDAKKNDLVLIIIESESVAKKAINSVIDRINYCLVGVPKETRVPNHVLATTSYARPLPGSDRMYPETDVASIVIDSITLNKISKMLPETLDAKRQRFEANLGINVELVNALISSKYLYLFDILSSKYAPVAKEIANCFVNTLFDLKSRENLDIALLDDIFFDELFSLLIKQKIKKAIIPYILSEKIKTPNKTILDILSGVETVSDVEVLSVIKKLISENKDVSKNAIMGMVMAKLRGKVDGKVVSDLVLKQFQN